MRRGPGLVVALASFLLLAASSQAATVKVTTSQDEFGTGPNCSLREAIQAANTDAAFGGCPAGSGADVISARGGVRYIREQTAIDDTNAGGDYDISSPITIAVRGSGMATIDAGGLDRAIQILPGGSLKASRLVITNGDPTALEEGGGIFDQGKLSLSQSTVIRNEALGNTCSCGGGIEVDLAQATLDRVRVIGNRADNIGGGVAFFGGTLNISRSTIAKNHAGSSGGGIEVDSHSHADAMTVKTSTISRNNSTGSSSSNFGGGGIEVENFNGASLKATNVTIVGNTSAAEGGGVFTYVGDIHLNGATITGNTSQTNPVFADGGGIAGNGVLTTNSIIAGNTDQNGAATNDCFIGEGGFDHNLVGLGTGCSQNAPNIKTANPKLGPLAHNGGPTKTIALLKGSPGIGRGDRTTAPTRDQRGVKRDAQPDIGAYERR